MLFDLRRDLTDIKTKALEEIDSSTGAIRSLFITTVPGQEMVYQEKRREAERVLHGSSFVDEAEIPHIAAEAAADGVTVVEKATEILTMAQRWSHISSLIEERRLSAKARVKAATTVVQIRSASQIDWTDIKAIAGV